MWTLGDKTPFESFFFQFVGEDAMWLYTSFLRVIVHVLAITILVGSTLVGIDATELSKYSMSVADISVGVASPLVGGIVGFLVGAIIAGLLVGSIALLFEIRDALRDLRDSSSPVKTGTTVSRKEPNF
jgi:predicted membrane protein